MKTKMVVLCCLVGVVVLVCLALYFTLQTASASSTKVKSVLGNGLRVNGFITRKEGTKPLYTFKLGSPSGQMPIRTWYVNLEITNDTPWVIELGNDVMLVEGHTNGKIVNGSALYANLTEKDNIFIEPSPIPSLKGESKHQRPVLMSSYGIENYELRYQNGSRMCFLKDYFEFQPAHQPRAEKDEAYYCGFGELPDKQTRPFVVALEQGSWIKDEFYGDVRLVLPKMTLTNKKGVQNYRLVLYLSSPKDDKEKWHIKRNEVISLEFEELSRLVQTPETNFVTRILAANWLAEEHPMRCGDPLSITAKTLEEGQLLNTCLWFLK